MHRKGSRYADHPRITWFGDGAVAYVDYVSATESFFIGGDLPGGFKVIPPNGIADESVRTGFGSIDAGIEYALAAADGLAHAVRAGSHGGCRPSLRVRIIVGQRSTLTK
jgi:hypothetical protein